MSSYSYRYIPQAWSSSLENKQPEFILYRKCCSHKSQVHASSGNRHGDGGAGPHSRFPPVPPDAGRYSYLVRVRSRCSRA